MAKASSFAEWLRMPVAMMLALERYPGAFAKKLWALSRCTYGDLELEELLDELWLEVEVFQESRGRAFDPHNPGDQKAILKRLNRGYMKDSDRRQRRAARIDRDATEDAETYRPAIELKAPATSDPALMLEERETLVTRLNAKRDSYSQAAAYAVTFAHFDNHKEVLSAHLAIAASTLMKRVSVAIRLVMQQPSLFDRIERITDDFMPREGRALVQRTVATDGRAHFAFDFGIA